LGRYNKDPDKFMIEFRTLALGFDLTSEDVQFLLANHCTPTERKKFFSVACREADEAFTRDPIGHHEDVTAPMTELLWDYNTPGGRQRRAQMLEATLVE
jgi:hypothetical protein